MRVVKLLARALLTSSLFVTSASAWAQGGDDAAQKWTVTVTPRYQQLFFRIDEDANGLESLSSYGGSVGVRTPDNRFGIMATYLSGKGSGAYTFDGAFFTGDYAYKAHRREAALTLEYTPAETNVTLLAGFHRFSAGSDERLITPLPGNSEVNAYRNRINAAELGIRLASRLGANSRQTVSAQFLAGIGRGRYKADEREVFNGSINNNLVNEKGTGYIGDIALGYNIFLTDSISVGARGRGYIFYVDVPGSDPLFALAPELNLSVRF